MNKGAARAARSDRKLSGVKDDVGVPKEFKKLWAALSHKQKGKLRKQFRIAQKVLSLHGQKKEHMNSAVVDPKDLKL